jgi:hypothetical protein
MEPDHSQLEFDLPACFTYPDAAGQQLWSATGVDDVTPY